VIQILSALATHSLALVLYPGLVTLAAFGYLVEISWSRVAHGHWLLPDRRARRPSPVLATVALSAMLAAVQVAVPFNPMPSEERNLIVAAIALGFTVWVELALTLELVPEPGLLLVIQFCWLLAVLGPAVQPESLRPQVLGNVLVPALLPVKIASGFLYLLCLPALLRLWPIAPAGERRSRPRFNGARALIWLPYCGLFTTLFFPPPGDDALGLLRFFATSFGVAAVTILVAFVLRRRGAEIARGLYSRAIPPYAALVLALVIITSVILR
jgi:hypothetical protein